MTDNLRKCHELTGVTNKQSDYIRITMETEEAKLLREFREKYRKREEERTRREARITFLKRMIEEISATDDIASEEDSRIEEEIDEAQRLLNARDQNKTVFRIMESVYDVDGNEVATFDATINLKTNPARIKADKQAILVALLMKDQKVKFESKLMGDVDLNIVKNIQFKIPIEISEEKRPQEGTKSIVPRTEDEIVTPDVPERKGVSPIEIRSEETFGFD